MVRTCRAKCWRSTAAEAKPHRWATRSTRSSSRLRYDRPIETSLAAVGAARASSLSLLELLDEAGWRRTGTHTADGPYGVETWLRTYAGHAHDHADQLRRAAVG